MNDFKHQKRYTPFKMSYNTDGINLGDYLKQKRQAREWAVYYLHQLSGVSTTYINHIESKIRKKPSVEILKKLAIAFEEPYEKWLKIAGYLDGHFVKVNTPEYNTHTPLLPIIQLPETDTLNIKKDTIESIPTDTLFPSDAFGIRSTIDIPELSILKNDICIIHTHFDSLIAGDLVLVLLNKKSAIRKYQIRQENQTFKIQFLPQSPGENSDYELKDNKKNYHLHGKIISIIRQL